jgi:hypothetical protein
MAAIFPSRTASLHGHYESQETPPSLPAKDASFRQRVGMLRADKLRPIDEQTGDGIDGTNHGVLARERRALCGPDFVGEEAAGCHPPMPMSETRFQGQGRGGAYASTSMHTVSSAAMKLIAHGISQSSSSGFTADAETFSRHPLHRRS